MQWNVSKRIDFALLRDVWFGLPVEFSSVDIHLSNWRDSLAVDWAATDPRVHYDRESFSRNDEDRLIDQRVQRHEFTRSLRSVTLPVVWVTNRLWRMSLFLEVSFDCSIVLSSESRSFCLAILKHSCETINRREHSLTAYLECVAILCRVCSFVISTNRSSFDELLSSLQVHVLFLNCPDLTELSSLVS